MLTGPLIGTTLLNLGGFWLPFEFNGLLLILLIVPAMLSIPKDVAIPR